MSLEAIERHLASLPDVTTAENFGYRFFFYSTGHTLPFVTIADSDNEHDRSSNLDRDGVYRVNIGISRTTYQALFPEGAPAGDPAALNQFLPHPHYAAQHFICVLNPTGEQLNRTLLYIDEAHALAKTRFERKAG